MKKILCPTDFSDTAQTSIAYAAKLAKAMGSTLTLLHVKSVTEFSMAEAFNITPATTTVADELEAQSREISKTFKIACYAEVVSTPDTLSNVIRDNTEGYDLMVMGTNGTDDLYQFIDGSTTYNATMKSNIPVLLIPAGYLYCQITNVVFAYDYLREQKLPLTHLAYFTKALNSRLTVLEVAEEAVSKVAEQELNDLQFILKTYSEEGIDLKFDTIRSSNVAQSINDYIQRVQPDVLALCSVRRNPIKSLFHKSTIKSISASLNFPVYVFHE
jgi:nucleotide-binding universal stress UspA family protein